MAEKGKARDYPIYEELAEAYDFYNAELFKNSLPQCLMRLSKSVNSFGCFYPLNFIGNTENNAEERMHEIAMNVQYFALRKIELTLSTLVHEMCHLKTYEMGEYGRGAYHNKAWAEQMELVGLMPTTTGFPDGKKTGQSVTHYIITGGLFEQKTKILIDEGYLLPFVERLNSDIKSYTLDDIASRAVEGKPGHYIDEDGEEFEGKTIKCGADEHGDEIYKVIVKDPKKKNKTGYICKCNITVWGRPGLEIECKICGELFVEKD